MKAVAIVVIALAGSAAAHIGRASEVIKCDKEGSWLVELFEDSACKDLAIGFSHPGETTGGVVLGWYPYVKIFWNAAKHNAFFKENADGSGNKIGPVIQPSAFGACLAVPSNANFLEITAGKL